MASKTTNYGLNKHSPQDFYNVEARNENWDKIDEALAAIDPTKVTTKAEPADGDGVMIADSADGGKAKRLLWSNVKAALGKLFVPLARKVNGKTLTEDVTLTAADIKMPNSEEDVGAAMAKRDVEYGVIEPENLQEWASAQTAGGTFMLTPSTTKGVPEVRYWRGVLSCAFPWNDRALLIFTSGEMYRTGTAGGQWSESWRKVADCIAPETHQLPLADGWTPLTDDCTYCKTQENIVTVNIRAQHSTTISGISRETVATLPTGFRPTGWISSACALDSGDSGGAMNGGVHVDANGSVIINGFDSYRVVYAQISFLAVN